MKARIDALTMRLISLMPYGYAVLVGMLLQQLIGGVAAGPNMLNFSRFQNADVFDSKSIAIR